MTQPKNPENARTVVVGAFVFAGLLCPPLAWIVQICASEALAAQWCYPANRPLSTPLLGSLEMWIGGVSAMCIALAIAGVIAAWGGWKRTRLQSAKNERAGSSTGLPMRFLALVGLISSPLFLLGSLLTGMAALIVSPCRPW
jgi:hypothetical protein